jgi:penicillin-binding protein 1A
MMASEETARGAEEPNGGAAEVAPPRGRLAKWAKRVGAAVALGAMGAALAVVLLIRHYEAGLPSTAELKSYNPPQVTRILARDGTLLGELFVERRTLVPIEAIPARMKLAALAAEDASFYEHAGLNYLGMLRALAKNVVSTHTRQGGSTITQQVVKNVLLTPERTFARKMREVILARRIEAELSKDEILDLYLNHIYFGHGRYGVEEAARYYFGKSIRDVTLGEAATLAGIIKGPSVYSPRADAARALSRRDFVLAQMQQKGFATADLVAAAKKERLALAPEPEARPELAPEVVDEVKRTLRAMFGPGADRGGYTVTTTIDPALEAAARTAVRKNLDEYAKRHKLLGPFPVAKGKGKSEPTPYEGTPPPYHAHLGVVTGADDEKGLLEVKLGTVTGVVDLAEAARYNPKGLKPSELAEIGKVLPVSLSAPLPKGEAEGEPPTKHAHKPRLHLELGPQSALVAVDVRTREILALVGSYEGVRAGVDRTTSRRQPGSTFKPFVYSYGIHARTLTAATLVETNPMALPKDCRPRNYEEVPGQAPKLLRNALAQSVNASAAWSILRVGPTNVVAWARALGVAPESKLGADCSLALGAYEVSPREMVGAYATFAAGGTYEEPILIQKIVGPNGAAMPLPERAAPRRVLEEAEAYLVTSLLGSVVQEGTGKRAKALGRPIAGKTGTSNEAKDAWFVGYSTDVACAVWTGYDDPRPMGHGEAGAQTALPAFVDFMREAHKKRPATDFPVPGGLVRVLVDPATGLRAWPDEKEAVEELFLAGSEPSEVAAPDAGAPAVDAGKPAAAEDAGAPAGELDRPSEAPPF